MKKARTAFETLRSVAGDRYAVLVADGVAYAVGNGRVCLAWTPAPDIPAGCYDRAGTPDPDLRPAGNAENTKGLVLRATRGARYCLAPEDTAELARMVERALVAVEPAPRGFRSRGPWDATRLTKQADTLTVTAKNVCADEYTGCEYTGRMAMPGPEFDILLSARRLRAALAVVGVTPAQPKPMTLCISKTVFPCSLSPSFISADETTGCLIAPLRP